MGIIMFFEENNHSSYAKSRLNTVTNDENPCIMDQTHRRGRGGMTLNQLESFLVLARRLSFTQAAEDLFISQPTLSRMISALEQELGLQLFYRSSRSVSLTPAGRAFARECPRILDSCRAGVDAAQLAQRGLRGRVTVGILRDTFDTEAVKIYQKMAGEYPQIHLELRELSHSDLIRAFMAGEVDAIINTGDALPAEEAESVILRRDRQCAVVPVFSPLARTRSLRMEDLRDEDFVVMSRASSLPGFGMLWRMAAEAGFTPRVAAQADHVPSLLMLVACGVGVTTLTDDLEYLAQGMASFIPLVGVPLSCHALAWRRDNPNPSLPFLLEAVRRRPS